MRSTSPGLVAVGPGWLSVQQQVPTTATSGANRAIALIAPMTAAAPPMSIFIHSMPSKDLRLRPPVSKVMPLPTRWTTARGVPAGCQRMRTRAGGSVEPALTPSSPPQPSAASRSRSHTSTLAVPTSGSILVAATSMASTAAAARSVAVRAPAGRFTKSRASAMPWAIADARATAAAASVPSVAARTTRSSGSASSGSPFCSVNRYEASSMPSTTAAKATSVPRSSAADTASADVSDETLDAERQTAAAAFRTSALLSSPSPKPTAIGNDCSGADVVVASTAVLPIDASKPVAAR